MGARAGRVRLPHLTGRFSTTAQPFAWSDCVYYAAFSCPGSFRSHGLYQMGELQARSWTVAATPSRSGRPARTAS